MGARAGHHVIVNGALAWVPYGDSDPPKREDPKPAVEPKAPPKPKATSKPKS